MTCLNSLNTILLHAADGQALEVSCLPLISRCSCCTPAINSSVSSSTSQLSSLVRLDSSMTLRSQDFLHQSPSGPSTKCPLTSNAEANCRIMCAKDGCSNSSALGRGGSHRGLWCRPRNPRCNRRVTSQNTNRKMSVRKKSSPKNCT